VFAGDYFHPLCTTASSTPHSCRHSLSTTRMRWSTQQPYTLVVADSLAPLGRWRCWRQLPLATLRNGEGVLQRRLQTPTLQMEQEQEEGQGQEWRKARGRRQRQRQKQKQGALPQLQLHHKG
jgi:hypothetical protein